MYERQYSSVVIGSKMTYYDKFYDGRHFDSEIEMPNLLDHQLAVL